VCRPVIRDVDKKDLLELSKELEERPGKRVNEKLARGVEGRNLHDSNQGGIGAHIYPHCEQAEVAILGLGPAL